MVAMGNAGTGGAGGGNAGAGMTSPGGTGGEAAECTTLAAIEQINGSVSWAECAALPGNSGDPHLRADCIKTVMEEGAAFAVIWEVQGEDSALEAGYVGYADGDDYHVFKLSYDSLGFVSDLHPEVWNTEWTECRSFSIADSCDTLDDCFTCEVDLYNVCGCGLYEGAPTLMCAGPSGPAEACDDTSACLINGICYPNGTTTEDGCCSCENGQASCIDPGWCPSWPLIGKRCTTDDDCSQGSSSGLACHASVSSSDRNICTRSCNNGCPTGTECVHVGQYSGLLCMRTCTEGADCNIEVFGEPLGSECISDGASASYCQ